MVKKNRNRKNLKINNIFRMIQMKYKYEKDSM